MTAMLTATSLRAHLAMDDGQEQAVSRRGVPLFLTVDEAAELLRTTRRAIYAMVERRQLPGVVRLRRRLLFRSDVLLDGPEARAIAEGVNGDEREHQATPSRRVGRGHHRPARDGGPASRTAKAERELLEDDGQRVGRAPQRELLLSGPKIRKEVPTLEAFAPRLIEGYARANRQKPSGIAAKEGILRIHLIPELGLANARHDQQRAGAATQAAAVRQVSEDGQQRIERAQRAVEAGGRVGCAGQDALFDPAGAGSANRRGVPRLR